MAEVVVTPSNTSIVIAENSNNEVSITPGDENNLTVDSEQTDLTVDSVNRDVVVTTGDQVNIEVPDDNPSDVIVTASESRIITIRTCDENGTPTGDKYFKFTQNDPATQWVIDHNLGKEPALQSFDKNGNRIFGDEKHPTLNRSIITYSEPISGYVNLN